MLATVYRCRREGVRLDPAAIRAEPVSGDLRVQRRGFNNRMAVLLGPDGERYMLPVLDKVRMLAMNDRGVLLAGVEMFPPRGAKGSGPMFQQAWWCVMVGGPVRTAADPAEARRLAREREGRQVADALMRSPTRRGTFTP